VSALYDTTRAITSTLDPADVLRLMEERIAAALALRDLVLLRYAPDGSLDAYATRRGRLDLGAWSDLSALTAGVQQPVVRPLGAIATSLPAPVRAALAGPEVLSLPLIFKGLQQGVILGSTSAPVDLAFAAAIASQACRRARERRPFRDGAASRARAPRAVRAAGAAARGDAAGRSRASCTTASVRPSPRSRSISRRSTRPATATRRCSASASARSRRR
jgi:hypothetical protein